MRLVAMGLRKERNIRKNTEGDNASKKEVIQ